MFAAAPPSQFPAAVTGPLPRPSSLTHFLLWSSAVGRATPVCLTLKSGSTKEGAYLALPVSPFPVKAVGAVS